MQKQWMLRRRKIDRNILKKININPILLSVLANRGITSETDVVDFMNPSIDKLHDPILMKDMDKGTDIIIDAIHKKKKIAIYGDYDADGITSTFILYSAFSSCGADVKYHIPDRVKEGYGINEASIECLHKEGFNTIITCDNGISAISQIKRAKELGMTVVVTDHHDVPFEGTDEIIPDADAVIDPKQKECKYPFKMLCGAGIAFKFVQVVYDKLGMDKNKSFEFIEYAAIGTICDVVDLLGENRIIAKCGLEMLNRTQNLGIQALVDENSLNIGNITSYHVGFVLGPCINATGRLDNAVLALKLFLSQDKKTATELAKKLRELNMERQNITMKGLEEIVDVVENSDLKKDRVLVVYREGIHESVAGIIAGRLKEKYNLPSIVLTNGEFMAKGSGRSIDEYNMFEELSKCRDLFENFGGHQMAAGMSIKHENIDELRRRLNQNCTLTEKDIIPKVRIDKALPLENINFKIIKDLKSLEPFGKGNSSPLFAERNIAVFKVYFMGKDKNTVKLFCRLKNSMEKMDAIIFNGGKKFRELVLDLNFKTIFMDFVFSPSINEFNGNTSIQLIVRDFRMSKI
ncbi:single-stranded-DNA-specific exonuclease RecJ [Clostridium tyrobutyricum]|uniref:single-stranded-DNA-specific exonuclease RecJ n=1 Tax=Clostridium tyrobutyricum TaxID=1519 RepID=UPI001C3D7CA7|nr:single-stranded-DNA-specific exonuclease RecJ [Clostridium tyrobutyricum]MBV4437172.1 single-stranded-DNA-specific exonuclease RecJ [Clostridium tyrobutyricum]MEA5009388.1 single-stranded-DNA-specific exonuclease RecJ [Clostridium tyrobutyricum]